MGADHRGGEKRRAPLSRILRVHHRLQGRPRPIHARSDLIPPKWCETRGLAVLPQVQAIHVAAYTEELRGANRPPRKISGQNSECLLAKTRRGGVDITSGLLEVAFGGEHRASNNVQPVRCVALAGTLVD